MLCRRALRRREIAQTRLRGKRKTHLSGDHTGRTRTCFFDYYTNGMYTDEKCVGNENGSRVSYRQGGERDGFQFPSVLRTYCVRMV